MRKTKATTNLTPIELVTSEMLARCSSWEQRLSTEHVLVEMRLADGRSIGSDRIEGVLNRLTYALSEHLGCSRGPRIHNTGIERVLPGLVVESPTTAHQSAETARTGWPMAPFLRMGLAGGEVQCLGTAAPATRRWLQEAISMDRRCLSNSDTQAHRPVVQGEAVGPPPEAWRDSCRRGSLSVGGAVWASSKDRWETPACGVFHGFGRIHRSPATSTTGVSPGWEDWIIRVSVMPRGDDPTEVSSEEIQPLWAALGASDSSELISSEEEK